MIRFRFVRAAVLFAGFSGIAVHAQLAHHSVPSIQTPVRVPLTADRWSVLEENTSHDKPDVRFIGHEGFPEGAIVIKNGVAALNGFTFRDGTIEFDMKSTDQDIPGIQFRVQGEPSRENAEEFYVRTFPECRASNDCIQYAPVINGFMLWNVYPQYQTRAPILDGWNHFKLVVSGRRMNVYINGSSQAVLAVGNLESSPTEGSIQFRGPAVFANLTITAGVVEGLSPVPTPDPTAGNAGLVRAWQLGPQTPANFGKDPVFSEAPRDASTWKPVAAGRFGLVNLNRSFEFVHQPPSLTWLRYTVTSNAAQDKRVQLGWLGDVWVFVNGKLITQGKNFYEPENERREPDGRLSLENGSFVVPLQRGANQVTLALRSAVHDSSDTINYYGWGAIMRFSDPSGLQLPKLMQRK